LFRVENLFFLVQSSHFAATPTRRCAGVPFRGEANDPCDVQL